jgi:chromosome segregation ATPase
MTTITETITQELINAVENPAEIEKVIHDRSKSKGPFYMALAQATALMTDNLKAISGKCQSIDKEYSEAREKMKTAEREAGELSKQLATKNEDLESLDEKMKEEKALLDQANQLRELGFGRDELGKLYEILAQIAASQGAKPEESVNVFFQEVDRYEKIVSLELEAGRLSLGVEKARAEVARWQAESKAAEAQSKARKLSIDITDKLISQGVRENDIPQWTRILVKADTEPEKLATILEQFASVQKLCQERHEQVKKLEKQIKELHSQVKALNGERDEVNAAIIAIRDGALAAIDHTSTKTLKNLNLLMDRASEYGELERQAGALKQELVLAQAFRDGSELWAQISRKEACNLVIALIRWCQADATHNPLLPRPTGPLSFKITFLHPSRYPLLEEVLLWVLDVLLAKEKNKKALPSGQ